MYSSLLRKELAIQREIFIQQKEKILSGHYDNKLESIIQNSEGLKNSQINVADQQTKSVLDSMSSEINAHREFLESILSDKCF